LPLIRNPYYKSYRLLGLNPNALQINDYKSIDYYETFALVVRYNTLQVLLAKVAVKDLEIDQIDVNIAFLNPDYEEEIYMQVPDYFKLIMPGITK
jgi:hypothetical protein